MSKQGIEVSEKPGSQTGWVCMRVIESECESEYTTTTTNIKY